MVGGRTVPDRSLPGRRPARSRAPRSVRGRRPRGERRAGNVTSNERAVKQKEGFVRNRSSLRPWRNCHSAAPSIPSTGKGGRESFPETTSTLFSSPFFLETTERVKKRAAGSAGPTVRPP